jgi:integrase
MSDNRVTQRADSPNPRRADKEPNISPDGKWKSFPRVPHLLQYIPSGMFYGRLKAGAKLIRQKLDTDVFTTAKLRLGDFIKGQRRKAARPVAGTFAEAVALYEARIAADHTLKDGSKLYRRNCVKALLRTWPDLDAKAPTKITEADCREWASRFTAEYDEGFFNNTLSSLRHILERAGIGRDDNPAFKIKRLGVRQKELKLPEQNQFDALLQTIQTAGSRHSQNCVDFVRFLAFSGCRLSEARQVTWRDVDFEREAIRVQTAKRAKTSGASAVRFVPIIPQMRELLTRLKEANPAPETNVCLVGECEKSLTNACKKLQIHRITHHDLRHLFATRCIESGVDVPTVSHWLGHSDGGALAMKTYGHLRREHSATMAQKVTFGSGQHISNGNENHKPATT